MTQKEKILVLKTIKYSESDLIVHGLNPLGARIGFIAKGGLKSRKRFAGGVLEPTHYIEVTYKLNTKNEGDCLHTLLEAQLIREFPKLRTDYKRLETALHMVKLVHRFSQEGVIDSPELFNVLGNGLSAAETSESLEKLRLHFEIKLLSGQGILPHDEMFREWIHKSIASHTQIDPQPDHLRLVQSHVHDHLRHHLPYF